MTPVFSYDLRVHGGFWVFKGLPVRIRCIFGNVCVHIFVERVWRFFVQQSANDWLETRQLGRLEGKVHGMRMMDEG